MSKKNRRPAMTDKVIRGLELLSHIVERIDRTSYLVMQSPRKGGGLHPVHMKITGVPRRDLMRARDWIDLLGGWRELEHELASEAATNERLDAVDHDSGPGGDDGASSTENNG